MSGGYAGGYHGTGDFQYADPSGSRMFRDHARLKARGAANVARAPSRRPVRRVTTRGPGASHVGRAPSGGAGAPVAGVLDVSSGAGAGIVVPNGIAPSVVGPGLGVTTLFPANSGDAYLLHSVGWEEPEVVLGPGPEGVSVRTPLQINGEWWEPPPGWSDAGDAEQALGEDGPGSFMFGIGYAAAWYKHNAIDRGMARDAERMRRADVMFVQPHEPLWDAMRGNPDLPDDSGAVPGSWDWNRTHGR